MSLLKQNDRARKNEVWENVFGHRMKPRPSAYTVELSPSPLTLAKEVNTKQQGRDRVGTALWALLVGWREVPLSLLGSLPSSLSPPNLLARALCHLSVWASSCQGAQRPLRVQCWGWQAAGHGHSG